MKIDSQQYWLLVARFWLLVASYWLLHLMSLDQRKAYITQKSEERAKIQAENSVGIKNAQSLTIALRIFIQWQRSYNVFVSSGARPPSVE